MDATSRSASIARYEAEKHLEHKNIQHAGLVILIAVVFIVWLMNLQFTWFFISVMVPLTISAFATGRQLRRERSRLQPQNTLGGKLFDQFPSTRGRLSHKC